MFRNLSVLLLISVSAPALAQRTTNNAVTSADDAFGRSVGNERIGIYSIEDVRGFNPIDAGNARIEGLYFDQQAVPGNRVIDGSTIRVGYSARGYPFPAPTGIVDMRLETFEGETIGSADFESDERGNIGGSIQLKLGLAGKKLGISLGQGFRRARIPFGRFGNFQSRAALVTWRPDDVTELTAFWSVFNSRHLGASPIVFPATGAEPPRINRHAYLGQGWAFGASKGQTEGVTFKRRFGALQLDAGLFRSIRRDPLSFADLARGTNGAGVTPVHLVVADRNNRAESVSGEIRVHRDWAGERVSHRVQLSVKGRDQSRAFGGQVRIPLAPFRLGTRIDSPPPVVPDNPNDVSKVRQVTVGLGYDVALKGRASLSLALQKSDYRKETDFANPTLPLATTRDKPWLYSINGTVTVAAGLTVYGGYVRGLEESAVAPDIAVNRGEAPPAIRTSQKELGLRYAISPKFSVIAGVFSLRKPYYNIDPAQRFRQLGNLTNRGVELSLAGTVAHGLTLVAGTILLDPKISGADVTAGLVAERPVGSFRRRAVLNLDWMPQGQKAWSFDLALDSTGSAAASANPAALFSGPARETVGLGFRYRFHLGTTKLLLRGQALNALNDYGWRVSSSGGYTFTQPRSFVLNIAADI